VAQHKILGIETEYGIVVRGGGESNPVTASSLLINAYVGELERERLAGPKVAWDFEDESPGNDARGASGPSSPPDVETHLVNAVLTNGARYYVDHAHPELSTPECADPRSIVVFDRAAELILQRSMVAANRTLPQGQEIVVYKNNSDRKGNSYGTHENYLMDRGVPFGRVVAGVMPHFITRQIYCGAGKVGLETTLKRPIVNTRDEPHADAQKYRRLHVIVGDANLCEVATFLKVGTTAIVLAMVEDGFIDKDLSISTPVAAIRAVSHDPTLRQTVDVADLGRCTALEVQWEVLR